MTHDSVDVPLFVADNSSVESNLQVDEAGRVKDVTVRSATSRTPATGDLRLEIVAPDGTTVLLRRAQGQQRRQLREHDLLGLGEPIDRGGGGALHRRVSPRGATVGSDRHVPSRNLKLRVSDEAGSDEGTLNAWGLDLRSALCDGSPVASLAANPNPVLPGTRRSSTPRAPSTPTAPSPSTSSTSTTTGLFEVDNGTQATYNASFGSAATTR
jgi:subtilisin-like proprotein convertase family protein